MFETIGRNPLNAERVREMILDVLYGEMDYNDSNEYTVEEPQDIMKVLLNLEESLSGKPGLEAPEAELYMKKVYYKMFSRRVRVPEDELSDELFWLPDCFEVRGVTFSKPTIQSCMSLIVSRDVAVRNTFLEMQMEKTG